jgi:hypothetical protein
MAVKYTKMTMKKPIGRKIHQIFLPFAFQNWHCWYLWNTIWQPCYKVVGVLGFGMAKAACTIEGNYALGCGMDPRGDLNISMFRTVTMHSDFCLCEQCWMVMCYAICGKIGPSWSGWILMPYAQGDQIGRKFDNCLLRVVL